MSSGAGEARSTVDLYDCDSQPQLLQCERCAKCALCGEVCVHVCQFVNEKKSGEPNQERGPKLVKKVV